MYAETHNKQLGARLVITILSSDRYLCAGLRNLIREIEIDNDDIFNGISEVIFAPIPMLSIDAGAIDGAIGYITLPTPKKGNTLSQMKLSITKMVNRQKKNRKKHLSPREQHVISEIINYQALDARTSLKLRIGMKTVYCHINSVTRKIGFRHSKSFFIWIHSKQKMGI